MQVEAPFCANARQRLTGLLFRAFLVIAVFALPLCQFRAALAVELHNLQLFRPRGVPDTYTRTLNITSSPREFQVLSLFNPFEKQSLLVTPDARPGLTITENFPRLDGSTSFLPVYAVVFKAIYRAPSEGEALTKYKTSIRCSSSRGFASFLEGRSDIFFGFEPSDEFKRQAEESGAALRLIPLGKEAFVFCVNVNNPVNSLTLEEVRKIYSGALTNWAELGGPDRPIAPFRRKISSGSQTVMERHVMQGTPFARESLQSATTMLDLLDHVARDYRDDMAIGYSFLWFVTEMAGVPGIKTLSLNGVYPDTNAIRSARYPLIVPFYAIVREGGVSPETQALLNWLTGPEGQALIAKVGYVPLGEKTP